MKYIIMAAVLLFASGCSEEQQNRISRLGVSWMEGNYKVTFYEGNYQKTWTVLSSKVTSDPQKGYYYFWIQKNGKKKYVQVPIARTVIEEL